MGSQRADHCGELMRDLERLISDKQNTLRGRPRDWIDDCGDWRRNIDWASVAIIVGMIAMMLAILATALWL